MCEKFNRPVIIWIVCLNTIISQNIFFNQSGPTIIFVRPYYTAACSVRYLNYSLMSPMWLVTLSTRTCRSNKILIWFPSLPSSTANLLFSSLFTTLILRQSLRINDDLLPLRLCTLWGAHQNDLNLTFVILPLVNRRVVLWFTFNIVMCNSNQIILD